MNFRNNFAYVQRQIDIVLRQYHVFARVYIDDIVVFNKILKKHLKHLTKNIRVISSIKHRVEIFRNVFELLDRCFARTKN